MSPHYAARLARLRALEGEPPSPALICPPRRSWRDLTSGLGLMVSAMRRAWAAVPPDKPPREN